MVYKGYCFWASNIPNPIAPHFIIITSDAMPDNFVMLVVVSSIKYRSDGTEKYYDKSCVLNVGDIIDNNGRNVITKPSFIRYCYTTEINASEIIKNQFKSVYKYKCKISNSLLKRIQDGAKVSPELEEHFKKYFNYF